MHFRFRAGIQKLLEQGHMIGHAREQGLIAPTPRTSNKPVDPLGQLVLLLGHDAVS
jgi:hypothetical protein